MNLSNTAQYAIRSLTFIAHNGEGTYSAATLVDKLNISDKYLKRILTVLTHKGIIKSLHGRYGGVSLNKKPENISLFEIISAVEDVEKYYGCVLGFDSCSDDNPCSLHMEWAPIRNKLLDFLNNTTLNNVIENPQILKF
jgi:Rrf2 family protein